MILEANGRDNAASSRCFDHQETHVCSLFARTVISVFFARIVILIHALAPEQRRERLHDLLVVQNPKGRHSFCM